MPRGAGPPATTLGLHQIEVVRARRHILNIPNLTLPLSGASALIGPNGAGKTTLLQLIQGLLKPAVGQLNWSGGRAPRRAILLQEPVLLRRSVAANIDFVLRRLGIARSDCRGRVVEYLKLARLTDCAKQPARRLSGGQQRRLAFAQALAQEPDLLLLDEPVAGLDPASAAEVERMIRDAVESGRAVIFSGHDIAQVRRLADRALFLHVGNCKESGHLPEMLERPQTRELAAFLNGELLR